jgi:hypothetical protein
MSLEVLRYLQNCKFIRESKFANLQILFYHNRHSPERPTRENWLTKSNSDWARPKLQQTDIKQSNNATGRHSTSSTGGVGKEAAGWWILCRANKP